MPRKNIVKTYGADQYYHIFNRGVNRQNIFLEPSDYYYFINLLKRHLSNKTSLDSSGRKDKKFNNEVELVAYYLMPSHFHLLCYLKEPSGIVHLMRSVMTAYTMYFNKKYKRTGKLCDGTFLAKRIDTDTYLWHVSRYIHLNPLDINKDFRQYDYSSIAYFTGEKHTSWLNGTRLVETESDRKEYLEFVADYKTMHNDMKLLKNILASQS